MPGLSAHFVAAVILYELITGMHFTWSNLSKGWQEFFEGVTRVDYAAEDKKGDLSTHWRRKFYRFFGWSPPYLEDAYKELCVEISEEDKMRGYGVFFHLFFDNLFLGGDLPKKWPRERSEGRDVVVVQGEKIETKTFKNEVLYPAYAEHYRKHQEDMEELLRQMPNRFKAFSRLKNTMPGWKRKVMDYAKKRSKLYPNGPLAFTSDEQDGFAENAAKEFINKYPKIVKALQAAA